MLDRAVALSLTPRTNWIPAGICVRTGTRIRHIAALGHALFDQHGRDG
jgi:hypothetical protein